MGSTTSRHRRHHATGRCPGTPLHQPPLPVRRSSPIEPEKQLGWRADEAGQAYNINADTAAGEIAAAVGAEKLLLLTDVSGILADCHDLGSLVKEVDVAGVRRMVAEGKVGGGMIPKVECCVQTIAKGVKTASIIDGRVPHSLLLELLTDQGTGTMITG